ncbi:MAG: hypothetical protein IKW01_06440 [Firmicutes bacterium]|nr:hypothetical protein [Bacillota bacterium]
MKIHTKAVIIGISTFFAFMWANIVFGNLIVGALIPGGNNFQNSYFYPLYFAVLLLLSLVISCTYLIVAKINLLSKEIKDSKMQ